MLCYLHDELFSSIHIHSMTSSFFVSSSSTTATPTSSGGSSVSSLQLWQSVLLSMIDTMSDEDLEKVEQAVQARRQREKKERAEA